MKNLRIKRAILTKSNHFYSMFKVTVRKIWWTVWNIYFLKYCWHCFMNFSFYNLAFYAIWQLLFWKFDFANFQFDMNEKWIRQKIKYRYSFEEIVYRKLKLTMNFLRVLRLDATRFNFQTINYRNTPKIVALQIKNSEYKQQERSYKNFGHKRPVPPSTYSKFYCTVLFVTFVGAIVDWKW